MSGEAQADGADDQAVHALRASWQQVSHAYAHYLEAMTEVGQRSEPAWATCEIEAALTFTGRRADYEHTFARMLVERLPLVLEALRSGEIDHPKARVFADHLADLTDAQITLICTRLLPRAPGWTTGQLAHRLLREVAAVDHHHTRKRYQKAVAERGVSGFLAPDGTATITAHGLTPTEAAAAAGRLDALAAAVRRAGHSGSVHQIRADLFIRLLDGRYNGFSTDQIVAAMLADGAAESPDDSPVPHTTAPASNSDNSTSDNSTGSDPTGSDPTGSDPTGSDPTGSDPTGSGPDNSVAEDGGNASCTGDGDGSQDHEDKGGITAPGEGVRHGVEIRIGLTTLLGIDDHPAELPGWGPILPADARLLASRQHAAEWCFAITDAEGYLLHGGITRARPGTASTGPCRGGVVEIHISETRLRELADSPGLPPEWAVFIAHLARRHAAWTARPGDRDACLDQHPRARLPRLGLRRHIRLRDRTCVAPGCRRPAHRADQDHTHDHTHGGATVRANLAPLCERHHLMKHDGGWSLAQPEPGRFRWCSPFARSTAPAATPSPPTYPSRWPATNQTNSTVDAAMTVRSSPADPTYPRHHGGPVHRRRRTTTRRRSERERSDRDRISGPGRSVVLAQGSTTSSSSRNDPTTSAPARCTARWTSRLVMASMR